MGIEDKVIHPKASEEPVIIERTIDPVRGQSRVAGDLLKKAADAIRPPMSDVVGYVGTFYFVDRLRGPIYQTLTWVDNVPQKAAQMGIQELTKSVMRAYGVKVPGEDA